MGATMGLVLAAGPHLLSGGRHGPRALRILVLVVIIAAVVVGVILFVQRRRSRHGPTEPPIGGSPPPGQPAAPESPAGAPTHGGPSLGAVSPPTRSEPPPPATWTSGRPWSGHGAGHSNTISARELTKRFGEKVAVDQLSFEVRPGHVTGFLGPNGAGKSTTMRLIMGLDRPDGGKVTVNGRPYEGLAWPLREVGALLEAKAIHPGRSAFAHLWMLAKTNHIPRRRVDEVLDLVGLSSVAGQRVGGFSLGMSQRLGIAAALLGDPGVLMFDEPVNGLDTDGIRWVRQLLRHLASEGRSVFVSSHLMSEMAQTADEVVVIGRGRLIAQMPVREFTSRYSKAFVRVRSPQQEEFVPLLEAAGASVTREANRSLSVRGMNQDAVGELAFRNSILLHELAPQEASLEEAYMESTEADVEFGGTYRAVPGDGSTKTEART